MATKAPVDQLLEDVRIAKRLVEVAEAQLEQAVVSARQGNRTWVVIATALGVTRQSATSKYARACDE